MTIRRDIALLAEEGLVRRVRGGAALVQDFSEGRVPTGPLLDHDLARRDEVAPATVGMVVPSLDYYWPDVIRGVREAAGAVGVRVVLRGATYQAADEQCQLPEGSHRRGPLDQHHRHARRLQPPHQRVPLIAPDPAGGWRARNRGW
ncbi:DeoR family transcriptional regulator [Microbispora sp. NPDC049125]|uniref:DeoR family transcriptional regulator n=1 Tax=Microbispora sp. NPDC049125 TaxID=3154929 RepID=UPI003464F64C